MKRLEGLIVVLLTCASLSWAQSAFTQKLDVFAGYSYTHGEFSGLTIDRSYTSLSGWDGAVTFGVNRWLGGTADVAGYYAKQSCFGGGPPCLVLKSHAQTYLLGPQVSLPFHRITPFAHFLLGVGAAGQSSKIGSQFFPSRRFQNDKAFSFAVGGGADLRLAKHFAWRGQLDYLYTGFNAADNQQQGIWTHNSLRLATGIVFRF